MNARRKTTRREFLKGESARDALANLSFQVGAAGDGPLGPDSSTERAPRDYLLQVGRRAMACDFHVYLNAGQHGGAVEAASQALDLVEQLEAQLTVFRPESEVSVINRDAAARPSAVEARLFDLLSRCVSWSQATGGAYDITAGPLVKVWGFYTRSGRFPEAGEIAEAMQRIGSQHLELDPERRTIQFARPGMELNLGSVGKGYALDRCAEILEAAGVSNFLIHGGQSSILARGARDSASEVPEWRVALRHPLHSERRLAELRLRQRTLGTSGSGQQFFFHRGRRYGHVLDPRSGRPAEGVLSATVLAPDAAAADALATAFFVLGVDATLAYCETHPELSVVFVLPGARDGTVALETVGMDEHLLQVLDETVVGRSSSASGERQ
jgi:FAD:protein FMN transferase